MQSVQQCIQSGKLFEESFENTQCGKVEHMPAMWFFILSSWGNLRKHLKIHSGKRQINATNIIMHPVTNGLIWEYTVENGNITWAESQVAHVETPSVKKSKINALRVYKPNDVILLLTLFGNLEVWNVNKGNTFSKYISVTVHFHIASFCEKLCPVAFLTK